VAEANVAIVFIVSPYLLVGASKFAGTGNAPAGGSIRRRGVGFEFLLIAERRGRSFDGTRVLWKGHLPLLFSGLFSSVNYNSLS
jgi:hypothetical protein